MSLIHDPVINIILRALAVYFFMIAAIRIFGKKELAQLSVTDLVFILLISNAVQNAMVGENTTLWGGIIAAAALFIANFILKRILYKSEKLSGLVEGNAVSLIYKGIVNEENCRRSDISINELNAAIREHGVENFADVNLAMLEVDGNISVISNDFRSRSTISHPRKHKLKGRLMKR